ncbi:MAG: hypothetical protein HZB85_09140 [Deltaproteobacteria bacterium]|nr:hypothetical protein [Deltaproteobacteria bacterium]
MAGFLVITAPGASLGFRCAGLDTFEIGPHENISALLLRLQEEGKYGLIAVEDRLMLAVSDIVSKRIRKKGVPIIVPINIPEKWGEVEYGESPVVRLIRKAIGYQIKIKK